MVVHFEDEVDAVWASMHGIVALALSGPIEGGRARAKVLSQIVLDNTINAWTTTDHSRAPERSRDDDHFSVRHR